MIRPEQFVLVIDGDPFRYRVGFAAETPVYDVITEFDDKPERHVFRRTQKHTALQEFERWQEKHKTHEIVDCTKTVEAEPEEHARQMLRIQVSSVMKEVRQKYGIDSRDLRTDIYLSAGTNYRDTLATLKPYKGNRDKLHKPIHYPAMTDELKHSYKVIDVHGHEADDAVSIAAWQMRRTGQQYIIATIDKDLDQIPGLHYDYMKKVFYDVSEADAALWFWQQVLSGDATDNIGGACKIGPKKAESLLEEWGRQLSVVTPALSQDEWEREIWARTISLYYNQRNVDNCYYQMKIEQWSPDSLGARQLEAERIALENARLVYLQREPGELWTPPGQPKQFMKLEGKDLVS